jgi:mono/diheme cytochrome c family protein
MESLRVTLTTLAAIALGFAGSAAAQDGFAVDERRARRGKAVWSNTGCVICHRIGTGRSAGPDLAGLFQRRTADWVTRFLENTEEMLETDSIARDLLVEYKKTKMPQVKLSDSDIQAVMHFIAQEGQAVSRANR